MTDDRAFMIRGAQNFIVNQIEKKTAGNMIGAVWGTTRLDLVKGEYELAIYKVKKKIVFTFTKKELIEEYGSKNWKIRLLTRVNEIVNRMES